MWRASRTGRFLEGRDGVLRDIVWGTSHSLGATVRVWGACPSHFRVAVPISIPVPKLHIVRSIHAGFLRENGNPKFPCAMQVFKLHLCS